MIAHPFASQPPTPQRLLILAANVRGLRTYLGVLTLNVIFKTGSNIAVSTETFLNEDVDSTFGKMRGYTQWMRRDYKALPAATTR